MTRLEASLLHSLGVQAAKTLSSNFTIDQIYATEEQAKQEGLLFAKQWIDDGKPNLSAMTPEEIGERMDELARKYVETHDKEIIEELYELSRELEKMEKQSES